MNPFHHALLADDELVMENITLKLQASQDSISEDIYWFRPYLTANFPGIICDKKYFFLWGTDHAAANAGGVYWGKGDLLNLDDFQAIAAIVEGYQAETPFISYFPTAPDSEKLHFFYHTFQEPGNIVNQETRMFTFSSGELHTVAMTDRGRPLGLEPGEDHTGYMKMWGNTAIHQAEQNLSNQVGVHKFSTFDPTTRTFVRGAIYDQFHGIKDGRWVSPTFGWFFERYGQHWWLGTTKPPPPTGSGYLDSQLILAKTDANMQITEQIATLNPIEFEFTRNYEVYIEGDIAHIYFQGDVDSRKLYYATYNLNTLLRYL